MINLSSFIRFHALRTPQSVAMTYGDTAISYEDFYQRIIHLAGWMSDRGIGVGDVAAVLMKNSPAFLDIAFAASHLGAVFLPINYRLSWNEVDYILADSSAKLVFIDHELHGVDRKTQADVFVIDEPAQKNTLVFSAAAKPALMTDRKPTDLFRLMYTSGTTDRPKGVMHSYENFYWKSADHTIVLGLSKDTRLLITGPLYHVGAFDLPGIAVLCQGGMLGLLREFEPRAVLSLIAKEKLTAAWLAPVMTSALLSCEDRHSYDVSSLIWAIGGGERTPEQRIRTFSDYFVNARYIDAYGLTESSSGDTFMEAGREIEKIGSTGRATPHVEITIRDDAGAAVVDGETGEICLKGPKIFKGYWLDPAKTKNSFFDDWFRTGDMGHLDADGFLYITDRKKDMIISGGENIASSEVERVIQMMTEVAEVAVVGKPDPRWGETPVAIVVCKAGQTLNLAGLDAHCRAHLAAFKVPKQLVLRDFLPRNPSGKVLKRELRDQF